MIPLRSWTEIDLSVYERNLKAIHSSLASDIQLISVVKADAYGHGLPQIVERSLQSGINTFAVANIQEAYEIRNIGVGWPILLLGSLLPGEEQWIPGSDFIPTISTTDELNRLNEASKKHSSITQIHVKIDTGMGRMGIWHEEALKFLELIASNKHVQIAGLYTHFSDPIRDPEFTNIQRKRLQSILKQVQDASKWLIHSDNSATHDTINKHPFQNAVRIGLLQYGISPVANHISPLSPTLSFYTRVGIVKELPAGTSISYGKKYTLKKRSKIAVLTAGYGDGIPIQYGEKGSVIIHDCYCPILGQITMDQMVVDVSKIASIKAGDTATLIGKEQSASITIESLADKAGTIPWEVLCSITKRVKRIYKNSRN